MDEAKNLRLRITLWLDIFVITLLLSGMMYSPFLYTISLILMGVRIVFGGKMVVKCLATEGTLQVLLMLLCVCLLPIVSLIWTQDMVTGLKEMKTYLPCLIVPIYMLIISHRAKERYYLLPIIYCTLLAAGVLVGYFNYFSGTYDDTRSLVPYTRSIAFAQNLVFAISGMVIYSLNKGRLWKIAIILSTLFIVFVFFAQSVTGIVSLVVLGVVYITYVIKNHNPLLSLLTVALLSILAVFFGFWIHGCYDDYFTPKDNIAVDINAKTPRGNSYTNIDDGFIENGYFVSRYCNIDEVESAWKKRTGEDIHNQVRIGEKAYPYSDLVYRYLNSKGLRKDYESVMSLTDKDIENIKRGHANIVYAKRYSLKPRLYQTFYEFERYKRTGEVENMSIIQRYKWGRNALKVIENNIFIGTGAGDAKNILVKQEKSNLPSLNDGKCDPHNQILYTLIKFGLLGMVVMLIYFLVLPIKRRLFRNEYFVCFFVVVVLWALSDSCFETYMGRTFITFFLSYFTLFSVRNDRLDNIVIG